MVEEAKSAQLILLGPEQLLSKRTNNEILRNARIRENLVSTGIDEVHLVGGWGKSFRTAYAQLGWLRARLPSTTPIVCATATLAMDGSLGALCKTFGFQQGQYILNRRTNERRNIRFIFRHLSQALNTSTVFPDLAWVAQANSKIIVFCRTIDLCQRVTTYLRSQLPPEKPRRIAIRMFTALGWSEGNQITINLFMTDPRCEVIVGSVAVALGLNVLSVRGVVIFGEPDDLDDLVQKSGRAGRDGGSAFSVTYVPKRRSTPQKKRNQGGGEKNGHVALQAILDSTACLNVEINKAYENPGAESVQDCISAQRPSPCYRCKPDTLPAPPTRRSKSMNATAPPAASPIPKSLRQRAAFALLDLRDSIAEDIIAVDPSKCQAPISHFLPLTCIDFILDHAKELTSTDAIATSKGLAGWPYRERYAQAVLTVISWRPAKPRKKGYVDLGATDTTGTVAERVGDAALDEIPSDSAKTTSQGDSEVAHGKH